MHEIFPHLYARFFAKLLRQIVGGRFSDQGLPTAGGTIEEETFGCGMLKFFEKVRM